MSKGKKEVVLADDFYYETQEQVDNRQLNSSQFTLYHSFGFLSHKASNLHFLEDNIVLTAIGNALVFLNLKTNEQKYLLVPGEGAIGAIAVHPSKTLFAVAKVCSTKTPQILIFEYPTLKLYRILRNGAEKGYSDICFNASGSRLASVAIDPDYTLTIWDWKQEKVILKSKAFSQDVYRVCFAEDDGILTTSGMGHIKFWRISSTFTGMKLQGFVGKFGASELSDISSFLHLPAGKVLSSTETGNLLLWDGGMIKCEIGVKGKKPCHQGRVESVMLIDGEIVTAGEDGFMRVWDFETIDNADVTNGLDNKSTNQPRVFEMEPNDEILIAKDVKIKSIVKIPGNALEYLIQDQQGHLFKLDMNKRSAEKILSFHSGGIPSTALSPCSHTMASLGRDGEFRVYDYASKGFLAKSHYSSQGTCMISLPETLDCSGSTFAAGFEDGTLRMISYTPIGNILQHVIKPHKKPIRSIAISADAKWMATGSDDATVFFFQISSKTKPDGSLLPYSRSSVTITPIGFVNYPGPIDYISFIHDEQKKEYQMVVKDTAGSMYTNIVPHIDAIDTLESFEMPVEKFKLMPWNLQVDPKQVLPPPEKDKNGKVIERENVDVEAELKLLRFDSNTKFTAVQYIDKGYFLAGVTCLEGGELRLCNLKQPQQSALILALPSHINHIWLSSYLFVSCDDGNIYTIKFDLKACQDSIKGHESLFDYQNQFESNLKTKGAEDDAIGQYYKVASHESVVGRIRSIQSSFDDAYVVSSGDDGGLFIWRLEKQPIQKRKAKFNKSELEDQMSQVNQPDDITDPSSYSLQEKKLKSEHDREIQMAEEKKQLVRNTIASLRDEYLKLVNASSQDLRAKISVDPFLKSDIETDTKEKIDMVYKEMAWISEKERIGPEKLKTKFLDAVKTEKIHVKGILSNKQVSTFRTLKTDVNIEDLFSKPATAVSSKGETVQPFEESRPITSGPKTPGSSKKSTSEAKSKLDAKKQLREAREKTLKKLMAEKPDEHYEDPKDLEAIRYAKVNMGDYKLKMAPDFVVSDGEVIDADSKKRQIVLLRESITTIKEKFNDSVRDLIQQRKALIDQYESQVPGLKQKDQTSYDRFNVTDDDVQRFKKSKESDKHKLDHSQLTISNPAIQAIIARFDANVDELFAEKLELETNLKSAEMKLLLLHQEWVLLKEFEKNDKFLTEKLSSKTKEREEIQHKLTEVQEKLNSKKVESEAITQQGKAVFQSFLHIIGENNKHEEYLQKVFTKKVKRSKKQIKNASDEEEEEEEEESDDDMSLYSLDEEDEEFEEKCPPDYDPNNWNKILATRELKLDNDDLLAEVTKTIDQLKKEYESLSKKSKVIDAGLKAAESEIRDFQSLKQSKLNELDVIVPLHYHQIQHLENNEIPTDFSNSVVFTNASMKQLHKRIQDLQHEKVSVKAQHKDLKKQHVKYIHSKKEKEAKLVELEQKAVQVQLLKFGRIIDLEKLEKLGVNKAADELKEKIHQQEEEQYRKVKEKEAAISQLKEQLMQVVKSNTQKTEKLVELKEQKIRLESSLNQAQSIVTADYSGPNRKDIIERQKLLKLVQSQASQIEMLKEEIELLLRKPISQDLMATE